MIARETLRHVIPAHAVYWPLDAPIDRVTLQALLMTLSCRSEQLVDESAVDSHWQALERRRVGLQRWDVVSPLASLAGDATRQQYLEWTATHLTPESLAVRAGYQSPIVDGVRYTVDYFNPANELEMPYRDAGEAVVALLLQSTEPASVSFPRLVRDRMPPSFRAILRDFAGILKPRGIHGCYSLMSTLTAFTEGRAAARYSPWDFLFQLHLLKNSPMWLTPETRIPGTLVGMLPGKEVRLYLVEDYGDLGVLVQIKADFNSDIAWEYFAVAKALGLHCIQELCEGSVS